MSLAHRWLVVTVLAASGCRPPEPPRPAKAKPVASSTASSPRASEDEAVRFRVKFLPKRRRIAVRATYPARDRAAITVAMPVWIPGSYLVREFSRHVLNPRAEANGQAVKLEKVAKNRLWLEVPPGAEAVELSYLLSAEELSVRTSFVDEDYAVLNPAGTFYADIDAPDAPIELLVERPARWPDVHAALPRGAATSSVTERLLAPDFDALVDAPVLVGAARVDRLSHDGVPVALVSVGDLGRFDFDGVAGALELLVAEQARFWGGLPFSEYIFLSVLDEAGGGLEHRSSTLVMFPPARAVGQDGRRRWLGLLSHELFHAWNGKRLRPRGLGPFDLEREAYTRSLWVVEGLTSYYDDLLLRRAGLHDDESYLKTLNEHLEKLDGTPGERIQSLEDASFDAWIKFYRPDATTPNTSVSYYVKGPLVAFALDAAIRARDRGSLDDALRLAFSRHETDGYTDSEWFSVLESTGGPELRSLAERLVKTPDRLDLSPALEAFGLRFAPEASGKEGEGKAATELGVLGRSDGGRFVVEKVLEGRPGFEAGISPGDELIALAGYRIPAAGPESILKTLRLEGSAELLVARRGRLRALTVTPARPSPTRRIEIDPGASAEAAQRRTEWLTGR